MIRSSRPSVPSVPSVHSTPPVPSLYKIPHETQSTASLVDAWNKLADTHKELNKASKAHLICKASKAHLICETGVSQPPKDFIDAHLQNPLIQSQYQDSFAARVNRLTRAAAKAHENFLKAAERFKQKQHPTPQEPAKDLAEQRLHDLLYNHKINL